MRLKEIAYGAFNERRDREIRKLDAQNPYRSADRDVSRDLVVAATPPPKLAQNGCDFTLTWNPKGVLRVT